MQAILHIQMMVSLAAFGCENVCRPLSGPMHLHPHLDPGLDQSELGEFYKRVDLLVRALVLATLLVRPKVRWLCLFANIPEEVVHASQSVIQAIQIQYINIICIDFNPSSTSWQSVVLAWVINFEEWGD